VTVPEMIAALDSFADSLTANVTAWTRDALISLARALAAHPIAAQLIEHFSDRAVYPDRPMIKLGHREHAPTVWFLGWRKGDGTPIHDHADSEAAITVMCGAVTEDVYSAAQLNAPATVARKITRTLYDGSSVHVPAPYIHRFYNPDDHCAASMHVYHPPLERMGYYNATSPAETPLTVANDVPKRANRLSVKAAVRAARAGRPDAQLCVLQSNGLWEDDEYIAHKRTCSRCSHPTPEVA
jgi:predicted metal-dependent enzyme (double-stranded beta helix superfamily)